jgi:hypothetical protein
MPKCKRHRIGVASNQAHDGWDGYLSLQVELGMGGHTVTLPPPVVSPGQSAIDAESVVVSSLDRNDREPFAPGGIAEPIIQ